MENFERIVLPAIRGCIGNWVYYSTLMSIAEISKRLRYANQISTGGASLSREIQRETKERRGKDISEYILTQPERFFNSLVVAVYGGKPKWHAQQTISAHEKYLKQLDKKTLESVGYLTFDGSEKLFAIDGQHRLAGINTLLEQHPDSEIKEETVSVIFVSHDATQKGLERTRRLFTTLNKKAVRVSKGDIIVLDEDDVMAICTRWLIEKNVLKKNMILRVASNNMPASNYSSLTTIGNIYDVLEILFTRVVSSIQEKKKSLRDKRPTEDRLEMYFNMAKEYILLLQINFPEIHELFQASDSTTVIKKYRGEHGGSVLFRPMGLEIFTLIVATLTIAKGKSLQEAVKLASMLPRELNQAPYEGLMWNSKSKIILGVRHKVTLREILLYMLGSSKSTEAELTRKYRQALEKDDAKLPRKIKI